ncbi:MAG TPA: nuclear transport factor 2 family protein [Novosphingobium sp.]|nr:nuclear transport factor 2 family protein [Novosphingobium sp.]
MLHVWQGINGLYFEYCEAINSYDRDRYARTFCEDAVLESSGQAPMLGREVIRSKVDLQKFGIKWLFQIPPRFHILEFSEESAKVRAYTSEISHWNGKGNYYLSTYLDHCVFEDGVWRFKHRLGDVLYSGAPDYMGERVMYPMPARY